MRESLEDLQRRIETLDARIASDATRAEELARELAEARAERLRLEETDPGPPIDEGAFGEGVSAGGAAAGVLPALVGIAGIVGAIVALVHAIATPDAPLRLDATGVVIESRSAAIPLASACSLDVVADAPESARCRAAVRCGPRAAPVFEGPVECARERRTYGSGDDETTVTEIVVRGPGDAVTYDTGTADMQVRLADGAASLFVPRVEREGE